MKSRRISVVLAAIMACAMLTACDGQVTTQGSSAVQSAPPSSSSSSSISGSSPEVIAPASSVSEAQSKAADSKPATQPAQSVNPETLKPIVKTPPTVPTPAPAPDVPAPVPVPEPQPAPEPAPPAPEIPLVGEDGLPITDGGVIDMSGDDGAFDGDTVFG